MERAIVLVNLSPGAEEESIAALRKMPGILSVYQLYGLYDLLVMVEGPDDQAVKSVIADNLRSKAGVVSTVTMKIIS
ncbi:MAG: Lrp/AsnC ligand binding domain-containing protein [Nitrososphaerales archaeon]|jgi:DNA-binding Lrp family transcriptional regulator